MNFNFNNILIAASVFVLAGTTLVVSHFLKARQDNVVVPTVYFWRQALGSVKRTTLFGRFSSIAVLFFLLIMILIMAITALEPNLKSSTARVIIIDTSQVTDLDIAGGLAHELLEGISQCSVITAGDTTLALSAIDDHISCSKAALSHLEGASSGYSSVIYAVNEGLAIALPEDVYLITGQEYENIHGIKVLNAPIGIDDLEYKVFKVSAPESYQKYIELYCRADNRFSFEYEQNDSDIVLTDQQLNGIDFMLEESVVDLALLLTEKAGLDGKLQVQKSDMPAAVNVNTSISSLNMVQILTGVCVLLLIVELYLYKKGRIV